MEIEAPTIIHLVCPGCGQQMNVNSEHAWETVPCERCGEQVPVMPEEARIKSASTPATAPASLPADFHAIDPESTGYGYAGGFLLVVGIIVLLVSIVYILGQARSGDGIGIWAYAAGSLAATAIFTGLLLLIIHHLVLIRRELKK